MDCPGRLGLSRRLGRILGICLILLFSPLAVAVQAADLPPFRPDDALTREALRHFYNMEYDRAIADYEKVSDARSDDPFAINNLLNCQIVRELYRMGMLDPTDYLSDNFLGSPKRPAGAAAVRTIAELLGRATALEEKRLRVDPNDVNMLYARGVTRAMRSSYTGLIDRSWFAALRSAEGSRRDHERVLKLSPSFSDADLIVGTHDYVLGSLPWAVKAAAAVVGFSGSRERGIEELQAAAHGAGHASIDAKILLALFLRREGRLDDALNLVRELTQLFPHNFIFALQEGDLLRASDRTQEALEAYRHVWDEGQAGQFSVGGYELAAVNMGDLQLASKDALAALSSYNLLEATLQAPPEIRQRAFLGAGRVYDLLLQRDLALQKYRSVIGIDGSTEWARQARKALGAASSIEVRGPVR